jgi:hypothetical protein
MDSVNSGTGGFPFRLLHCASDIMNPDSPIEQANRGDFHSVELLRCRRIFLFMNRMFYSLQKFALRLAFHPL